MQKKSVMNPTSTAPQPVPPFTRPPVRLSVPRKRAKGSRKPLFWASMALLAIASILTWTYLRGGPSLEYITAPADRGDIDSVVTTTGNLNAVTTVQVGSQVSGNIKELYADFNTKVKKGQLVALIDPAPFQAKVDQAQATLNSARAAVLTAQATLAKSQSDLSSALAYIASQRANVAKAESAAELAKTIADRRRTLIEQNATSQEDYDTARAAYQQALSSVDAAKESQKAAEASADAARKAVDVARAQLQQARAQVEQDKAALAQEQLNLDHTRIVAPVDGTVQSRNMDVGQTVAASFQAPTIFVIAQDLAKMQVDTNVGEADVAAIRDGQPATFTVDAFPGKVFSGHVSQIRQNPINVQNVITYDIVVAVSNEDLKLFPGMTANVTIYTRHASNVLRVPKAALRWHPRGSNPEKPKPERPAGGAGHREDQLQTVYVLQDGVPKPVKIELGISDSNYAQVVDGPLQAGDEVVTGTRTTGSSEAQGGPKRIGF
jgi:HlyD family secretion protein